MLCYSPRLSASAWPRPRSTLRRARCVHAPLRGARHEQIAAGATQESHFIESVRGLRAIKSFRRGEERRSAWLSLLIEQVNAGLRAERLQLLLRSTNGLLFGVENVLVIYPARASCSSPSYRRACCSRSWPTSGSSHRA